MEDLLDGFGTVLLKLLRLILRVVSFLFWELAIESLSWFAGWTICRIASFNQFPKVAISDYDSATGSTKFIVCTIGFAFFVALAVAIY